MGIASLILGIIAFFISLTIFKDLSLILAALAVVLGIIAFVKKKSKGLSIAGVIIAVISFVILFSGDTTGPTVTTNGGNNDNGKISNTSQVQNCKVGDTITIKKDSNNEYTLQITGIKETDDRNEFSDQKPAQVFIIDYTYTSIKADDTLYVSDMNFKIIDETGEIGESYPVDTKYPQEITEGTTCKAQMALCVYNNSNNIKLQFFENMFNSKPSAIYEIEL